MNNQFNFSYSAPTAEERKEIESIRKHYIPQEKKKETKLEKLRRMNAQVKNTAIITSVFLGIFGCLIFGQFTASDDFSIIYAICYGRRSKETPAAVRGEV